MTKYKPKCFGKPKCTGDGGMLLPATSADAIYMHCLYPVCRPFFLVNWSTKLNFSYTKGHYLV